MSAIYPSSTQPFLVLPFLLPAYVLATAAAARGVTKGLIEYSYLQLGFPVVFTWLCIDVGGQLGAKSSWSSIFDREEHEIQIKKHCPHPPPSSQAYINTRVATTLFLSLRQELLGFLDMISWRFIERGFVYAWDVGTGVKWTVVCTHFIHPIHSIHLLRYFRRAPSTSRSSSTIAGGALAKVSSWPSQVSSVSHLPTSPHTPPHDST